jgi:hypothetical protein
MTVSCAWEGCPASFAGGIPPGWVWIGLDDARPLCPAHRRALAEGDATWRAELADRHAKALKAIAAGRGPRTVLRHVVSYSVGLDSHARLPALLDLMEGMPAGVFWQVLTNQWKHLRRHLAACPRAPRVDAPASRGRAGAAKSVLPDRVRRVPRLVARQGARHFLDHGSRRRAALRAGAQADSGTRAGDRRGADPARRRLLVHSGKSGT